MTRRAVLVLLGVSLAGFGVGVYVVVRAVVDAVEVAQAVAE